MIIADFGRPFHMDVAPVFTPLNPTVTSSRDPAKVAELIQGADLVCLGGGADIHPSLYGHTNVASSCGAERSERDIFEQLVYETCMGFNKPVLAICRGAQLACALNGGHLIQHVDNHAGRDHMLHFSDGSEIESNSVHHQMMVLPGNRTDELVAWTEPLSSRYLYDTKRMRYAAPEVNPEIAWFRDSRTLAIQGHPEFYSNFDHPFVVKTRDLVSRYLGVR